MNPRSRVSHNQGPNVPSTNQPGARVRMVESWPIRFEIVRDGDPAEDWAYRARARRLLGEWGARRAAK